MHFEPILYCIHCFSGTSGGGILGVLPPLDTSVVKQATNLVGDVLNGNALGGVGELMFYHFADKHRLFDKFAYNVSSFQR